MHEVQWERFFVSLFLIFSIFPAFFLCRAGLFDGGVYVGTPTA
jgi:hypothetical protein